MIHIINEKMVMISIIFCEHLPRRKSQDLACHVILVAKSKYLCEESSGL